MIQSKRKNGGLYKVGCLGKIIDFRKSKDGRILINLTGITRFEVLEEKKNSKLYREFKVDYEKFSTDLQPSLEEISAESLMKKAEIFFKKNGLLLNWKEFEKLDKIQKINTLAMIAPVTNEEKQKLLESISLKEKVKTLEDIINFYLHEVYFNNRTVQ
jgi:hypothetical protein